MDGFSEKEVPGRMTKGPTVKKKKTRARQAPVQGHRQGGEKGKKNRVGVAGGRLSGGGQEKEKQSYKAEEENKKCNQPITDEERGCRNQKSDPGKRER